MPTPFARLLSILCILMGLLFLVGSGSNPAEARDPIGFQDAGDPQAGAAVIGNHAGGSTGSSGPDRSGTADGVASTVQASADLSVIKFSTPISQVEAGQIFTYTIFVENLGPDTAQLVSLRDKILSSGNFSLATDISNLGDPARADACFFASPSPGLTIECDLNEDLEPQGTIISPPLGGRWIIQIPVLANETQSVNNLVDVFTRTGGTPDPNSANNRATNFIFVQDAANLSLTKTATPLLPSSQVARLHILWW